MVPPSLEELFEAVVDVKEHKSLQAVALYRLDTQSEKGSHVFSATCSVQDVGKVCKSYKKMKLFYPGSDHIITACSTHSH